MVARKSISQIFSILLTIVFLLTGVFPVQADSLASPRYASGDFLWAKGMGGGGYDEGRSIVVDSSGNVYTTGYFSNTVDFDPGVGVVNLTSAGLTDIFISKLDNSGNLVWTKGIGGTASDRSQGIVVDSSGNVYTTGSFDGTVDFNPGMGTANLTSAGPSDIFVSKLDSNGDFVWARNMGGTSDDAGFGIALDSSSNVYTTGGFTGTADFDPGAGTVNLISTGISDIFVSKLDGNGNFVWARNMGGTDSAIGEGITVDSNGNIYTTGFFFLTVDFDPGMGIANITSVGENDIFVSKLDSSGNYLWAKSMGGTSNDASFSVALDPSGNVYTTGGFSGTADFDPGAGTSNLTSVGINDMFVSKLDGNGDFIWAKGIGGTSSDAEFGISVDSSGNIYTIGYFSDTVDFDPGVGTSNLTSAGLTDIFVSKLDGNGNFIWVKGMGGAGTDEAYDIAIDSSGNIYMTGIFSGTADFDPNAGTFNLVSAGNYDVFVSKLANKVIFVDWNAGGANNGTSWANAYTDLQSALSAASSGDEIWVAAGTYKPNSSIVLKNGVAIYGGFAGTETMRLESDPATNVTILSGDIGIPGNSIDNLERVVFASSVDSTTVLDGFTITGGQSGSGFTHGAGMSNFNSNPVLANLIFTKNNSSYGGGMYNSGSNPTLTNVVFDGNTAVFEGGGMLNSSSSPILNNVTFNHNIVTDRSLIPGKGGGMYNVYGSPTLINVTFHNNYAANGGGIYNHVSALNISNTTFSYNSASKGGGCTTITMPVM